MQNNNVNYNVFNSQHISQKGSPDSSCQQLSIRRSYFVEFNSLLTIFLIVTFLFFNYRILLLLNSGNNPLISITIKNPHNRQHYSWRNLSTKNHFVTPCNILKHTKVFPCKWVYGEVKTFILLLTVYRVAFMRMSHIYKYIDSLLKFT